MVLYNRTRRRFLEMAGVSGLGLLAGRAGADGRDEGVSGSALGSTTVYDDFEHGNLAANYTGDVDHPNAFSVVHQSDAPVAGAVRGEHVLEVPSGVSGTQMISLDAPPNQQPRAGKSFSVWVWSDGTHHTRLTFGGQRDGGWKGNDFYALWLRSAGGESRIEWFENGDRQWQEPLEPGPSLDPDQWYRVDVHWRNPAGPFAEDELGVEIYDAGGNLEQRGATTRHEVDAGRLGFWNDHDRDATWYFDALTDDVSALDTITVYDDFEHGNLAANYTGDVDHPNAFSVVHQSDAPVAGAVRGEHVLKVPSGVSGTQMISLDAPPNQQPRAGKSFSVWVWSDGTHHTRLTFGGQRDGGWKGNDFYALWLRSAGGESRIEWFENGDRQWQEPLEPGPSLDPDQWYRVDVHWRNPAGPFAEDELGVEIYDAGGNLEQRGATTRHEVDAGRLGFWNDHDRDATWFFDALTDDVSDL